jgi:hypothetical protein
VRAVKDQVRFLPVFLYQRVRAGRMAVVEGLCLSAGEILLWTEVTLARQSRGQSFLCRADSLLSSSSHV